LITENDESESILAEIQNKLAAGEDFAALAKSYSQDPGSANTGGDLGWVSPGDMVPEFDAKLFEMSTDTISEPVETQFGIHLIQLKEIKASAVPVFEEVKADIIQVLQANQSETVFLEKASQLSENVLDAEAGLEGAAEATGLTMKTSELFSRAGGEGVAANQSFINAAFSSTVKDELLNSDVINITDTHVVFMHINEVKAAEPIPLPEVKDGIVATLKDQKAADLAKDLADQLLAKHQSEGKTLSELATEHGLELINSTDIGRTGSTLPFNLVKNVFAMGRVEGDSNPLEVVSSNGSEVAVVELLAVNDVDVTSLEDIKAESAQLGRNIKTNEQQLLIQALRESAKVTINVDMLNQIVN
jgi:peptidyl-prolyl cis-trans isomerase D